MQEQGKRLLLTVALALGVILLWNTVFHKDEPPKPGQTTGSGAVPTQAVATVPHIGPIDGGPSGAAAPAGETIALAFDNVVATFSSTCGGLSAWQLTDKRYHRDATKGEFLPTRAEMTVVDATAKPDAAAGVDDACGAFNVNFVTASSRFVVPRNAVWKGERVSDKRVTYTYASDELKIVKDFTVVPETYLVRMTVTVNVHVPDGSQANEQLAVSVYAYQDPAALKDGSRYVAPRVWSSSTQRLDDNIITTEVTAVGEWPRWEQSVRWTGFDHPYLLAGYAAPEVDHAEKHTSAGDGKARPTGLMRTDLVYPIAVFKPGDAAMVKTVVGYLGPKNYDDLQHADAAAGFTTGFSKVVDLGWFAFIGRPLLWLLQKFREFAGNWGVSIILLTIVVKLLTLYWTTRSMRSMKAMAALAPQMKALQTKYADDKQRQQAETMALYKEHGVNPVAGCLPILLQMPVWIALYRMLANAGELYQQPFIPGWIDDLTATDPYYVLPAVLFITMFLQARLQPATGDSAQQKFLQYGMPIMFGVMAFFFPAGLTLYMFTNNVLSALHSIYMNKFDKHSLASAAKLKQNQELVAKMAAEAVKPGAASGSAAKKTAGSTVKRVIEAKATEVPAATETATSADGEDSDDDSPAAGAPGAGAARNRPRKKKRRR
jgi:YidC/Oxa1 family membrane protein insertase